MKKSMALVLVLICALGLAGCNNRSMNYIISNEPNITGIVKETNENAILIENETEEYWVSLNVENKDSMTSFNIGDEVVVYYDGNVAESYPMQISTVYAITLKTPAGRTESISSSIEETEDMRDIPGGTRFIIEIRDRTEEEDLFCAEAEELFYEDENTRYYFNVIKSHYIMVTYDNGNSEDIVTALNAGRATIADLKKYGIEYHTEPVSIIVPTCKSIEAEIAEDFVDPSAITVLSGEWAYTAESDKYVALVTVRNINKFGEYETAEYVVLGVFGGDARTTHCLNEHSPYTRENVLQEFGAIDNQRFTLE